MIDPLVMIMAGFMLDGARSADELHEAIERAIDLIAVNPQAQRASQLNG